MLADTLANEPMLLTIGPAVQLLLVASLAFTMLTVALALRVEDFGFIRRYPTSVLIGFLAQVIALPLATLLLIKTLSIGPALALGMLIVACCPGGSMSNLITRIAGGNTAYSVSLTMLSSVFSAAVLPLAILFWVSQHAPADALIDNIEIDRVSFVLRTCATLLIPLGIGMALAHFQPQLAQKLHRIFMPISLMILMLLILTGLVSNYDVLKQYGATMIPLVIVHNSVALMVGGLIGYICLSDKRMARALVFEVGIQNAGLGLIIILTELGGYGEAAILVGTWSIWHLIAGFTLANIFRRVAP
jgi:BASS family bile acid:Na+ symporter